MVVRLFFLALAIVIGLLVIPGPTQIEVKQIVRHEPPSVEESKTGSFDVICLHRGTVENYMDLIEAEDGPKSFLITLAQDVARQECIRLDPPELFPIDERGPERTFLTEKKGFLTLNVVRIRKYWSFEFKRDPVV